MANPKKLTDEPILRTICHIILDKSGSMAPIRDATIAGINEYIVARKSDSTKLTPHFLSLTLWDTDSIDNIRTMVPVENMVPLESKDYRPSGGTNLYDAVFEAITSTRERVEKMDERPAILVLICTDGEENSSRRKTEQDVRELIGELTRQGNWTFTYLGANQDAWKAAQRMGVAAGSTQTWDSSNAPAAAAAWDMMNSLTSQYSARNATSFGQRVNSGMSDPLAQFDTTDANFYAGPQTAPVASPPDGLPAQSSVSDSAPSIPPTPPRPYQPKRKKVGFGSRNKR